MFKNKIDILKLKMILWISQLFLKDLICFINDICSINKLYKIKMTESFEIENQEVLLTSNIYIKKPFHLTSFRIGWYIISYYY